MLASCRRMAKGSGDKNPSYRDIARKAGVSLMTVSLVPLPPGRLRIDFRWSAFSAVSTCYLSGGIGLNQVLTNRQHYIELALAKLRELGYRRIGLAIDQDMDVRSNHQTLAHFLLDQ